MSFHALLLNQHLTEDASAGIYGFNGSKRQ